MRFMELEPVLWLCDWCGAEFPADPECMLETGFAVDWEGEDLTWHGEAPGSYENAPVELLNQMKEEMDLSDAEVKELIEKGGVNTGYSCICQVCQNENENDESGID